MTTAITTYSSQYLVSHSDLVKFGVDMTQKAQPASGGLSGSTLVDAVISPFYLPQIIYSVNMKEVIEIIRKIKQKGQMKNHRIKVDRVTGYVLESKKEFSDIARFDHKTLPKTPSESLKRVGYWNILNQYIGAN